MGIFQEGNGVHLVVAEPIGFDFVFLEYFFWDFDEYGVAIAKEADVFGVDVFGFNFAELESLGLKNQFLALHTELVDKVEYLLVDVSTDFVVTYLLHVLPW